MNIPPYPLAWPDEQRRSASRVKSAFRTNLDGAIDNVRKSLRLFAEDSGRKLEGIQITTNMGLFDAHPKDPGIAVWFIWDGALRCIAVDRYMTVAENLQAIHHVLEARRVEMRHAGIEMVRTTFRGFVAALPAPGERPWHEILGVSPSATTAEIAAAYKDMARKYAQDGSDDKLSELNVARDRAMKAAKAA